MNIGAYLTTADIGAFQLVPSGGGGGRASLAGSSILTNSRLFSSLART